MVWLMAFQIYWIYGAILPSMESRIKGGVDPPIDETGESPCENRTVLVGVWTREGINEKDEDI